MPSSQTQSGWAPGLGSVPTVKQYPLRTDLISPRLDIRFPCQLTPYSSLKYLQNVAQAPPMGPWVWVLDLLWDPGQAVKTL